MFYRVWKHNSGFYLKQLLINANICDENLAGEVQHYKIQRKAETYSYKMMSNTLYAWFVIKLFI